MAKVGARTTQMVGGADVTLGDRGGGEITVSLAAIGCERGEIYVRTGGEVSDRSISVVERREGC